MWTLLLYPAVLIAGLLILERLEHRADKEEFDLMHLPEPKRNQYTRAGLRPRKG